MGQLKRKPDGLGPSKVYLGKVSVPAKIRPEMGNPNDVNTSTAITKLKPKEIHFLEAYAKVGTGVGAMLSLFPKSKYSAAHQRAWRWMKTIDSKVTPEEKFAIMGLTTGKLTRVVNEAMDAEFQKEFVTKDGDLVKGAVHPDHQIRLEAAKLGAKLLGVDKESNNPAIAINIVQYAPPNADPWPQGGSANPEIIDVSPESEEI